jgi:hypothetical protein
MGDAATQVTASSCPVSVWSADSATGRSGRRNASTSHTITCTQRRADTQKKKVNKVTRALEHMHT